MDKYEYKLKLDEVEDLVSSGNYAAAAGQCDAVNWNKVKNTNTLCSVGTVYEKAGRTKAAKGMYRLAYKRSPSSRNVLYHLTALSLELGETAEAEKYYGEFVRVAPKDQIRYILEYQIACVKNRPIKERISILEDLKKREYTEEWAYELAYLYYQAGMADHCVATCDELALWFGDGEYVRKALELKKYFRPLTSAQEEQYSRILKEEEERQRAREEAERKAREEAQRAAERKAEKEAEETRYREEQVPDAPEKTDEAAGADSSADTLKGEPEPVEENPETESEEETVTEPAEEETEPEPTEEETEPEPAEGEIEPEPAEEETEPEPAEEETEPESAEEETEPEPVEEEIKPEPAEEEIETELAEEVIETDPEENIRQVETADASPWESSVRKPAETEPQRDTYPENSEPDEIFEDYTQEPEDILDAEKPSESEIFIREVEFHPSGFPQAADVYEDAVEVPLGTETEPDTETEETEDTAHASEAGEGEPEAEKLPEQSEERPEETAEPEAEKLPKQSEERSEETTEPSEPEKKESAEAELSETEEPRAEIMADAEKKTEPDSVPLEDNRVSGFNTVSLESRLEENIRIIESARESGTIRAAMDSIRKMIDGVPYLEADAETVSAGPDENMQEILRERLQENAFRTGSDLQDGKNTGSGDGKGADSIEQVLAEWEKTKKVMEETIALAQRSRLERERNQALSQANDIMIRLQERIPSLQREIIPEKADIIREMDEKNLTGSAPEENGDANVQDSTDSVEQISSIKTIIRGEAAERTLEAAKKEAGIAGDDGPEVLIDEEHVKTEEEKKEREDEEAKRAAAREQSQQLEKQLKKAEQIMSENASFKIAVEKVSKEEEEKEDEKGTRQVPGNLSDLGDVSDWGEETPDEAENLQSQTRKSDEPEAAAVTDANVDETDRSAEPVETQDKENTDAAMETASAGTEEIQDHEKDSNDDAKTREEPLREVQADFSFAGEKTMEEFSGEEADAIASTYEEAAGSGETDTEKEIPPVVLLPEEIETFRFFNSIPGMEIQITDAISGVCFRTKGARHSATGNVVIMGEEGSGKTYLATKMIRIIQQKTGRTDAKIGKISAVSLNRRDFAALASKVKGGFLIVEKAGALTKETAIRMSQIMEQNTGGLVIILEDSSIGIHQALNLDLNFSRKFTEKVNIPIFNVDELVEFGRIYAHERDASVDEMGRLALYNRIENIQKVDHATKLSEVKEIIDAAIQKAENTGMKKKFGTARTKKYTESNRLILHEQDFE